MTISTSMLALVLMCLSPLALANHDPDAAQMGHSRVDTNGDGWISQEEFMAYQQEVWKQLPKNSSGMVSTKDMPTHHDKMVRSGGMQDHGLQGAKAEQEQVPPKDSHGQ